MMSIPPKVRSPFVWSLTKRQVCSLLLIVTLLCSSCLIAGYSYAASIGAQKYPTSYMEGGPTGAYHYMIYTFQNDTNTYYAAKNSFGDNIDSWTSTNQTAVEVSAYAAAVNGTVYLNHLTNSTTVPSGVTVIQDYLGIISYVGDVAPRFNGDALSTSNGTTTQTLPYTNITGTPTFADFANHTDIPQSFPYANITGSPTFTDFANHSDVPQSMPWSNITGAPSLTASNILQPYNYLVSVFSNGSYYAINGTDGSEIPAWTSTNGTAVLANTVGAGNWVAIKGVVVGRIEITASNMVLFGVGSGATLQLPAGADDNVVDITGNGVTNVKVLDLIIDGNKANNAAGDGIYVDTDYVSTDTGHVFQNLRIIGTSGDGIDLVADSRVCMLDNIYVGGNAGDAPEGRGFNLAGTDHHFTNLEVGFAEKSGFYIKTTNGKFTNCKAFACGSDNDASDNAGFSLVGANSGCYNSLTNCHAQDNKYTGFLLYNGARDNVFTNCHSDDNGQTSDSSGFKLDTACVRNKLIGCYVFDYAGTHMTMGLVIGTDCDYNTVVGNEFWNGQNDGIYISGGDYNYIHGNTINGFTAACINIVSGVGNRLIENNFVDVGTDIVTDGGTSTEVNTVYVFPERGTDLNFVGTYSGRYMDSSGDEAFFTFSVPSSASDVLSVDVVVVANASATMRLNFASEFGASGEDSDVHSDSLADVDVACTADYIYSYDVTDCFTGLTGGDYAGLRCFGDGTNTANLLIIMVVVRYV